MSAAVGVAVVGLAAVFPVVADPAAARWIPLVGLVALAAVSPAVAGWLRASPAAGRHVVGRVAAWLGVVVAMPVVAYPVAYPVVVLAALLRQVGVAGGCCLPFALVAGGIAAGLVAELFLGVAGRSPLLPLLPAFAVVDVARQLGLGKKVADWIAIAAAVGHAVVVVAVHGDRVKVGLLRGKLLVVG